MTTEIIERNRNLKNLVIVGIRTRGIYIGKRISKMIKGRSYDKLGAVIGPKSVIESNTVLSSGVIIKAEEIVPSGSVVKK